MSCSWIVVLLPGFCALVVGWSRLELPPGRRTPRRRLHNGIMSWVWETADRTGNKCTMTAALREDWIELSSVLRPCQHSIGYVGDGFYRSEEPTNSIKVLKEQIVHRQIKHTISRHEHNTTSPIVYNIMGWLGDDSQRAGMPGLRGSGAPAAVPATIQVHDDDCL